MAMRSLLDLDDPNSLCLVGNVESRELEEHFGRWWWSKHAWGEESGNTCTQVSNLEKCRKRAPLIVEVVKKGESWARLYWILHYDLGTRHTDGLKALSRMLAHHGHGSKPCSLCDKNNLVPNLIGHLLRVHQHEIGLDRTPVVASFPGSPLAPTKNKTEPGNEATPVDSVDQLVTQIANYNIYFLLPSALARSFEWARIKLWMRDVFSQCTCVRTCLSRSGMSIWLACTDDGGRGQARTALLDNGGRGEQWSWSSAKYVFCAKRSRRLATLRKRKQRSQCTKEAKWARREQE